MDAKWWSQPVAAEGSTASEGIRRQLGKPNLDPLTILIRETAQNSCDAAVGEGNVEYSIRLWRLSGNRLVNWTSFLNPEPSGSGLVINKTLEDHPLVLTVSDRGTTGLGGPMRSDEIPLPGERADFVNFIRNVGETKAGELSGGSYGFGKGILYNLSRCHVVVADSVCEFRGVRQRRLIGAALGDSYRHNSRLYTGRHWLGDVDSDGYPAPLLDDAATDVAVQLGLPKFEEGATGTSIAIVGVDLGMNGEKPRDPEDAAAFMVSTILWNLWPRMLDGRRNQLTCSVRRDGFRTDVPNPEELPLLAPFVAAYRQVTETDEFEIPMRKQRPRDVGRFSLRQGMAPTWTDEVLRPAAPFTGPAHHCALMRQADLVVEYQAGDPPPNEMLQYGAVFRASAEANQYFAEAEPPTHDAWVLSGLTGTARGVVQLAHKFVRDKLKAASAPAGIQNPTISSEPLGHFANQFASVIATAEGESATASVDDGPAARQSRGRRRPGARFVEKPSLVFEAGRPIVRATIEFTGDTAGKVAELVAAVVTPDGVEVNDDGIDGPVPLSWTAEGTGRVVEGRFLITEGRTEDRWVVRVEPVPDTVTRVSVRLTESGG